MTASRRNSNNGPDAMSSDPSAVVKKLYEAVLRLASEDENIEVRLGQVYFDSLRSLDSALLPPAVKKEWESILAELAQLYPQPGTTGADPSRAVDVAQRILLVYDSMIR